MRKQVRKMIGSDAEFANYIRGRPGDTCAAAVRILLDAIPGVPARTWRSGESSYRETLTDMGRRYVRNGGCFYNDSEHCEGPTPEVLSATEYVHYWRAVLLQLQNAAASVNQDLPEGERLCVAASNSDGHSNSWASHLNVLMSRASFDQLFQKPLHFLWLASFLVSSQIYTGAGKVGSENGAPPCNYQLSQRGGDFFEVLMSWNTMHRRGLLNGRDEAHTPPDLARLHCIYYDSNLADFASYLKVGALQLATAMLEAGAMNSSILMEDPVTASQAVSHSLGSAPIRMLHGKNTTALDLQYRFAEAASGFVEEGRAEGIVPEAETIVSRWVSTLDLLRAGEMDKLARRLDWVAKLRLIGGQVRGGRCTWDAPQTKVLDHAYASLDDEEGLFLALERDHQVDRLTDPRRVAGCLWQPPESTRAYTRARLLELGAESVTEIDWERIKFLIFEGARIMPSVRIFDMSDPLFWSGDTTRETFESATGLEDALNKLERLREDIRPTHELETQYGQSTHT